MKLALYYHFSLLMIADGLLLDKFSGASHRHILSEMRDFIILKNTNLGK